MNDVRKAMEAAVDALEIVLKELETHIPASGRVHSERVAVAQGRSALSLLRAALEAREEPVAWMKHTPAGVYLRTDEAMRDTPESEDGVTRYGWVPLYASPIAADTQGDARKPANFKCIDCGWVGHVDIGKHACPNCAAMKEPPASGVGGTDGR